MIPHNDHVVTNIIGRAKRAPHGRYMCDFSYIVYYYRTYVGVCVTPFFLFFSVRCAQYKVHAQCSFAALAPHMPCMLLVICMHAQIGIEDSHPYVRMFTIIIMLVRVGHVRTCTVYALENICTCMHVYIYIESCSPFTSTPKKQKTT